jgi:hypothetical protein
MPAKDLLNTSVPCVCAQASESEGSGDGGTFGSGAAMVTRPLHAGSPCPAGL